MDLSNLYLGCNTLEEARKKLNDALNFIYKKYFESVQKTMSDRTGKTFEIQDIRDLVLMGCFYSLTQMKSFFGKNPAIDGQISFLENTFPDQNDIFIQSLTD